MLGSRGARAVLTAEPCQTSGSMPQPRAGGERITGSVDVAVSGAPGQRLKFDRLESSGALAARPTPCGLFIVGAAAHPIGGDKLKIRVQARHRRRAGGALGWEQLWPDGASPALPQSCGPRSPSKTVRCCAGGPSPASPRPAPHIAR